MRQIWVFCLLFAVSAIFGVARVQTEDVFRVGVTCDPSILKTRVLSDACIRIRVKGTKDWRGTISVLNEEGYRVALVYANPSEVHQAGKEYGYVWDGADDRGIIIPGGTYRVSVEAVTVNPVHTWGGKWFKDHWAQFFFDSRGDEIFFAAVNSQEQPFTDYEFPECYGRFYDFDGLPMSEQIPLILQNQAWGNIHYGMDLKRNLYLPTEILSSYWYIDLVKINGRTGQVVWRLPGAQDPTTGEFFVPDGTRQGRAMGWHTCRIWDTSPELVCVGWRKGLSGYPYNHGMMTTFRVDAEKGALIEEKDFVFDDADEARLKTMCRHGWPMRAIEKQDRVVFRIIRQFSNKDMLLLGTWFPFSPVVRWKKDGTVAYILDGSDLNVNGSRFDGPTRTSKWGETVIGTSHDANPVDVDAAGNIYGYSLAGGGIVKYNEKAQMVMHAVAGVAGGLGADDGLAVSADGKLVALSYDHFLQPRIYELSSDRATVAISSSGTVAAGAKQPQQETPQTAAGCLDLARALVSRNQDEEAVKHFLKVPELTQDPDYCAVAYNLAGKSLERLNRLDEAVSAYRKLSTLPLDVSRGLIAVARCYRAQGKNAQAESTLWEAVKKAPDRYWQAKALLTLGEFHEERGNFGKALESYGAIVKDHPHAVPQGLLGRARCYLQTEQHEKALEDCRVIVQHYPIWSQIYVGDNSRKGSSPLYAPRECQCIIAECEKKLGRTLTTPRTEGTNGVRGDVFPDVVLGQKELGVSQYTILISGEDRKFMFLFPQGLFRDSKGLYVCDYNPGVISIFRTLTGKNAQIPDARFPLPGRPVSLTGENNNYYVSLNTNHLVAVYENIASPDAPKEMKFLLGQKKDPPLNPLYFGRDPRLVRNCGGLNASSLNDPYGVCTDGKRLFVADRGNNRVLVWDLPITRDFQPASLVLGQKDFVTNERNAGGVSASSLNRPSWVFSDGKRLVVSDCGNNRVLIWNKIPRKNFEPADLVLGAADFKTGVPVNILDSGYISNSTFCFPMGIWIDGENLYICDMWDNRVMIWDSFPTKNNQPADRILGQPPMEGIFGPYEFADWYYGDPYFANPTRRCEFTVGLPIGVCTDQQSIFVTDYQRQRVLVYYK